MGVGGGYGVRDYHEQLDKKTLKQNQQQKSIKSIYYYAQIMRTLDLQQLKTTGSPSDRSSSDSVMHGDSPSHPRTNPEDVDRFYQPLYDFHESDFDINDDLDTGWMIAANAAANMRYSVTGAATVAARANEIGVAGAGGGEHNNNNNNNNNKTANAAYTRESAMVDDFGLGASNLLNVSPPSKRRAEIVDRFQLEYTVSSGGPMDYPSTIRLSEEFPMYNTSFLSNHQPGNDVFSGGGNGVAAATGQITDVHPNCSSNYSPEYESQLDSSTALTADSAGSSSLMNKSPMAFMINTSSKSVDSTQKPTLETTTTTPSSNKKLNHSKISGNLSTTTNTASMIACVVCSDKSSGKHYGQYTCEGCKSFFKRSVRRNMLYNCKGTKTCPVDQPHRNQCQYCRFQKCIMMGMRKESAVQKGRSSHHYLLLTNRKNPSTIPQQQQLSSPSKTTKPSVDQLGDSDRPVIKYEYMSQEHRHLSPLTYSVGACNNHHELDHSNTNHILHSQTPSDPPKPSTTSIGETIARVNQLISQTNYENNQNHSINVDFRKRMLAEIREAEMRDKQYDPAFPTECIPNTDSIFELTARLIFIAVRWARDIPIFTDLFTCDRVELLRGSWCHMFLIKVAQTNLSFENVLPLTEEAERDSSDLNLIIDRVEKIRELSLNTVEYGCLKAAVLFSSDSLDIADKIKVSYLQEQAFLSLNDTIKASRGLDVQRLIKILIQAHLIKSIHPDIVERLFFSQTIGRSKMTLIINDMVLSNGYITALDTYRRF